MSPPLLVMPRVAVAAVLVAGLGLGGVAQSQPVAPATAPRVDVARLDFGLQARALAPGVYVVEGANADFSVANGCNIINTGFIVTDAGVVVINTGPSRRYGEQLRALITRTTPKPVLQVIHLNLHPDYFLGNQAFADVPRLATALTRQGMAREAKAYEDNLYRLCGDWMKGTEALLPDRELPAEPGSLRIGGRELRLTTLQGHTDSDLVLTDVASGVVFVGGLVFVDRVPTTPHARLQPWLQSLQVIEGMKPAITVPSHGPVNTDGRGVAQTRGYLRWLDASFSRYAQAGWEPSEVLRGPVPAEYRQWAAFDTEFIRNVTHLYPAYEAQQLKPGSPRR